MTTEDPRTDQACCANITAFILLILRDFFFAIFVNRLEDGTCVCTGLRTVCYKF